MTRRWAVATVVASVLLGVVSVLVLLRAPSVGAGTIAPLTDPTPVVGSVGVQPAPSTGSVGPPVRTAVDDPPTAAAPQPDAGARNDIATDDVAVRSARLGDLPDDDAQGTVPVRLRIPDLGIDAEIDPVGVEADGSMTVPQPASRLGWYRHGPAPGDDEGSAVIAGHVDSYADGPGAFFDLAGVEPGATVTVTLADGSDVTYEVTGRERIEKAALPTDDIFRRTGPGVLTLVTCGGDFDDDRRSYADNVVVVAVEQE